MEAGEHSAPAAAQADSPAPHFMRLSPSPVDRAVENQSGSTSSLIWGGEADEGSRDAHRVPQGISAAHQPRRRTRMRTSPWNAAGFRPARAAQEQAALRGVSMGEPVLVTGRTCDDGDGCAVKSANVIALDGCWEVAYEFTAAEWNPRQRARRPRRRGGAGRARTGLRSGPGPGRARARGSRARRAGGPWPDGPGRRSGCRPAGWTASNRWESRRRPATRPAAGSRAGPRPTSPARPRRRPGPDARRRYRLRLVRVTLAEPFDGSGALAVVHGG